MLNLTIIVGLFILIFIASIVTIGFMLISISKQGDERRRLIVLNASADTFYITVGLLLIDAIVSSLTNIKSVSNYSTLLIVSFVYAINLIRFKKKFGG